MTAVKNYTTGNVRASVTSTRGIPYKDTIEVTVPSQANNRSTETSWDPGYRLSALYDFTMSVAVNTTVSATIHLPINLYKIYPRTLETFPTYYKPYSGSRTTRIFPPLR